MFRAFGDTTTRAGGKADPRPPAELASRLLCRDHTIGRRDALRAERNPPISTMIGTWYRDLRQERHRTKLSARSLLFASSNLRPISARCASRFARSGMLYSLRVAHGARHVGTVAITRYLSQLDTADRQEPSEALAAKTTHLKEKLVKLKDEMERLKILEGRPGR